MCWTQHPIAERSGAACGFRLLLPATTAPEDLDAFPPSGRTGLSSWFQSWLISTQCATWGLHYLRACLLLHSGIWLPLGSFLHRARAARQSLEPTAFSAGCRESIGTSVCAQEAKKKSCWPERPLTFSYSCCQSSNYITHSASFMIMIS